MSAKIEIARVIHRVTRKKTGRRSGASNFLMEVRIDGWLPVRTHITRDTFEYLVDHGVPSEEQRR